MSKLRINCKHCGQLVKVKNTKNGYCYKVKRDYKTRDKKIREELYLDCERFKEY